MAPVGTLVRPSLAPPLAARVRPAACKLLGDEKFGEHGDLRRAAGVPALAIHGTTWRSIPSSPASAWPPRAPVDLCCGEYLAFWLRAPWAVAGFLPGNGSGRPCASGVRWCGRSGGGIAGASGHQIFGALRRVPIRPTRCPIADVTGDSSRAGARHRPTSLIAPGPAFRTSHACA
jgi:hypothetical protein